MDRDFLEVSGRMDVLLVKLGLKRHTRKGAWVRAD